MSQVLSQSLGDTVTHRIPLRWGKRAFVPGVNWALVFTVKSDPVLQDDENRLFQKATGGLGVVAEGSNAVVSVLRADTIREAVEADPDAEPPVEEVEAFEAAPGTYFWDVQATHLSTGEVRTVANGTLVLTRDVTRQSTPTGPIFTAEQPALSVQGPPGKSAYQSYLDNTTDDPPLSEAAWIESFGSGGGSGSSNFTVTISANAPTSPLQGDVWIDTAGWIESYWLSVMQEFDGELVDNGYWVSLQSSPSDVGFLIYGSYFLIWTDENDIPNNLIWTPNPTS
jgi:hypothetical protein